MSTESAQPQNQVPNHEDSTQVFHASPPAADSKPADLKKRAAEKLIHNLEDLTKAYRHVLELVRKEKELLLQADLQALTENNLAKEKMILRLKSLDGLRIKYAGEIARLVGLEESEARLLEIARLVESTEGERLRTQQATLEILIRRVKEINQANEEFTQSALNKINGAMSNVKETVSGKKTYGRKGKMQSGTSTASGNFISKET